MVSNSQKKKYFDRNSVLVVLVQDASRSYGKQSMKRRQRDDSATDAMPLLCHAALPKSTHALIQAEHFSPVQMQSVKVVTAAGFLHRSLLPPPTCPLLRHQSVIAIVTFFIVKCIQFFLRPSVRVKLVINLVNFSSSEVSDAPMQQFTSGMLENCLKRVNIGAKDIGVKCGN